MNEYPEWLIRKVAAAAAYGVDDTEDLYGIVSYTGKPWTEDYIAEWEEGARVILDTLEFHQLRRNLWVSGAISENDT